jgi:hypothetical protein
MSPERTPPVHQLKPAPTRAPIQAELHPKGTEQVPDSGSGPKGGYEVDYHETARAMQSGKVESSRTLGETYDPELGTGNASKSVALTLKDEHGTQVEVVFKPVSGVYSELDRMGIPKGSLHLREVAAYRVAQAVGYHEVPPTIIRDLPDHGGVGSAQRLERDATPLLRSGETPLDRASAERMRVFDYLSGNADRHSGNLLVRGGEAVPIDHGLSFPPGRMDSFRQPTAHIAEHSGPLLPETKSLVAGMDGNKIASALKQSGISAQAARASLERMEQMKVSTAHLEIEDVSQSTEWPHLSAQDRRSLQLKAADSMTKAALARDLDRDRGLSAEAHARIDAAITSHYGEE